MILKVLNPQPSLRAARTTDCSSLRGSRTSRSVRCVPCRRNHGFVLRVLSALFPGVVSHFCTSNCSGVCVQLWKNHRSNWRPADFQPDRILRKQLSKSRNDHGRNLYSWNSCDLAGTRNKVDGTSAVTFQRVLSPKSSAPVGYF